MTVGPALQAVSGLEAIARVLADEAAPACALGADGEILLVNAAWDAFARENGGAPACLRTNAVGKRYFTFVPGHLRAYHEGLWLRVLAGRPAVVLGDCSAPGRPRVLSMHLLPVRAGAVHGVALHAIRPAGVTPACERDAAGHVVACSVCRRVRTGGARWAYVPECIDPWPDGVHGFCPTCARLARAAGNGGRA